MSDWVWAIGATTEDARPDPTPSLRGLWLGIAHFGDIPIHKAKSHFQLRSFISVIAAFTVVMLGLMYLDTHVLDHVFFNAICARMALCMGSIMTIAMMLNHSIAFLISSRTTLEDLWVRALIGCISGAQRRGNQAMEWLIQDSQANGKTTTPKQAQAPPVPTFTGSPSDG